MLELRPDTDALHALTSLFARGPVAVLTGAGISTESGIPDYRGPETRRRARNPVQYREFVKSAAARRRYWARSVIGWPRISAARPNAAHHALAALERAGHLAGLITQNVDGLHLAAGSHAAIELHGALREVICMACACTLDRAELQRRLLQANPGFAERVAELAPDGDAELADDALEGFVVHDCEHCGGPLKPHVVFFGENVPRERVDRAMDIVRASTALLVVGSSLAIFSGLRFVHAAVKHELPVAIVNLSETRGDDMARVRVHASAGACLSMLVNQLVRAAS